MALNGGGGEGSVERKKVRERVCTKGRQSEEGGGVIQGSAECTEED